MRKITDFIVKGRYVFLAIFIIAAIFSLYLSNKVNINDDIMKYLPKTSETKIGKDIMDEEFAKQDSSVLNVMFKGLSDSEKIDTLKKLQSIDNVSSVDYENTEEYNKDNYTLYVLNVDDYDYSITATSVYNYVKDNFKVFGMSGSIYDENKPILQLWIVILAIACAMIILIILSDSYVEPWLYLISIGIAVFINKGTNIMFESVSSITNSIVAILQLALSMDYSIMLSNRYKQEKLTHSNKIDAMKEALYHSFKAISSSSVTTIVGLVALVFMSFTIGKDLGFVLAKGVLLSLISIFFCLPALLLIFDNLIIKTKKKSPKFNLTRLGKFIYKTRYVQSVLIIILFVGAYFLKGNIEILYTGSEQDKVAKIFPTTNQIAIVYNNKYEELIANYCKKLEKDENIDQTLCYSNTINEKLAYNELNKKFKDLGQDTQIEEYLIKLIYYNYYNKDANNKMTLNEFVSFIKSDIYTNDNFNNLINQDIKNNLEMLENFTSSSLINKKRSPKEIADILGMNKDDAEKILIYYNSKNVETKMTIKDFVNFMLNDVANDNEYSSSLDGATISKLKQLQKFTDKNNINKKMDASELSSIFGIDKDLIAQLFLFYRTTVGSNTKMTLNEFANFTLNMARNDSYKNMFDENTIKSLTLLKTISNKQNVTTALNKTAMKASLNNLGLSLDDNTLSLLYIYYTGSNTDTKLTLNTFATIALQMANNKNYKSYFNKDILSQLFVLKNLTSGDSLPKEVLYQTFNINEQTLGKELLEKLDNNITKTKMTPLEFEMILQSLIQNPNLGLSEEQVKVLNKNLTMAQKLINDNKYHTPTEIVNILNQDKTVVSMIYGGYDSQNGKLKDISVKELINFLYSNNKNPLFAEKLTQVSDLLQLAHIVVNNLDTTYSYAQISSITNTDKGQLAKIFGIYDYNNKPTTLTPLELTNLILNNKDNELLKGKISNRETSELSLVKDVMTSTLNDTKYTSSNLSSLLNIDNNTMSLLFSLYNSKYIKSSQDISLYNYVQFIVKDVMNNKDYSAKFDDAKKEKITTINDIMNKSLNSITYTSTEAFTSLDTLSDNLDKNLVDLIYMYYKSTKDYDDSWKMTIEEFINYLYSDILTDSRFDDFINAEKKATITDSKNTVDKSKDLIVSDKYSRVVLNTKYAAEDENTYKFINSIQDEIGNNDDIYIVGNSPMAVEMNKTFNNELNKITLLTMIFIFIVVAITFKDLIIPFVLVLIIQTAVYLTMCAISITGGSEYFISLLIVQAILMGATIDYAIVYTSYYRESRLTMGIKDSVINAYNKSIHTIISSSSILIIVTLVVAGFASAIAAKICETISQGTFASVILILFVLPGVLASTDKIICRNGYYKEPKKGKSVEKNL